MWVKGLALEHQAEQEKKCGCILIKGDLPGRALQSGNCPSCYQMGPWVRANNHHQPIGWKCQGMDVWLNPNLVEQCFGTFEKPEGRKHDVKLCQGRALQEAFEKFTKFHMRLAMSNAIRAKETGLPAQEINWKMEVELDWMKKHVQDDM